MVLSTKVFMTAQYQSPGNRQYISISGGVTAGSEAESRVALISYQKFPSGSTRRCAAGGQTTAPDKRAVDSHVQTCTRDRSAPRVPRGSSSSLVDDQAVESMKKLKDYLRPRQHTKTSLQMMDSPILSPDTRDALENAEKLVKEAQKKIIEASYDIASSPERDWSSGSMGRNEIDDEDAVYIRDIVATRFHEANESARIFTRPSTRLPSERVYRPEIRQRRTKRGREKCSKIYSDESTTARSKLVDSLNKKIQKKYGEHLNELYGRPQGSIAPTHVIDDVELATPVPKENDLKTGRNVPSKCKNPQSIHNQNMANAFKVQEGPRVDIRNELTVTNVEKVNISPEPRLLLVQQNVKTYEFQHESCMKESVDEPRNDDVPSIDHATAGASAARDSPVATEKSREPVAKSPGAGAASQQQGSWSDLVGNKSGRSILPERLEGHSDNVRTRIPDRGERLQHENNENHCETFMDFLRRSADNNAASYGIDPSPEILKQKVFETFDTHDKINIFDRAVNQFFDEFRLGTTEQTQMSVPQLPRETEKNGIGRQAAERDAVDGKICKDRVVEIQSDSSAIEGYLEEVEYFEDEWNSEEINLEPPNLRDLEKTLEKFHRTMDKVARGTRSLGLLMAQYSIDGETSSRTEIEPVNQDSCSNNPKSLKSRHTKEILSDIEFKMNDSEPQKKEKKRHEDFKVHNVINKSKELTAINSREAKPSSESDSNETSRGSCQDPKLIRREAEKDLTLEKALSKKFDSHPRFSTPLNNDLKLGRSCGTKVDCKSNEFARFLVGIHGPRGISEPVEGCSLENNEFAKIEKRIEDKIFVTRNEFDPTLTTASKNDLDREKKIILREIDRKCNLDSLFKCNRITRTANEEEAHETVTFPINLSREQQESSEAQNCNTKSLIHDSAVGETAEQSEDGDECFAKKDSSKSDQSAPQKNVIDVSQKKSVEDEAIISAKTQNSGIKDNVIVDEFIEVVEAKLSASKGSKSIEIQVANSHEEAKKETSNKIVKSSNDNQVSASSESSLKDRTSFDVSTVYSEAFEEPSISSEQSKGEEKLESLKTEILKTTSDQSEPIVKQVSMIKNDDSKRVRTPSPQMAETVIVHNELNEEIEDLKKSVSISVKNTSGKNETDEEEINRGSRMIVSLTKNKGNVENNIEVSSEVSEKSCKNTASTSSSCESIKESRASSIPEDYRRNGLKNDEELVESRNSEQSLEEPNVALEPDDGNENQLLETQESDEISSNYSPNQKMSKSCKNPGEFRNPSLRTNLDSWLGLDEIANFTLKHFIEDSRNTSGKFDSPDPDPIPNDDHATGGTDTCSENYSEGELYLPSSCSYSLGEIRISERGSCGTVGGGIESSVRMNADGMRIFFSKSCTTFNSSNNTINALNSPIQSLGEVQETDVESICSLRGISSDGEQHLGNRYNTTQS